MIESISDSINHVHTLMQYGNDEGCLVFTDEVEDVVVLDDFRFIAVRLFDAPTIDGVVKDGFEIQEGIRRELVWIRHWMGRGLSLRRRIGRHPQRTGN